MKQKRPKRNARDLVHHFAKAAVSAIPIVGSPANELLSLVVTPSLEKRRDMWIESIAENLKELEEEVESFSVENLRDNEAFVSILIEASQIAIKNHQEEKLKALRSAVLNAALPTTTGQDLQAMFLRFVDRLTPTHLKMLRSLFESNKNFRFTPGLPPAIKRGIVFPDFEKRKSLYEQVVKDLFACGLITFPSLDSVVLSNSSMSMRMPKEVLADLGSQFLDFITSPMSAERNDGNDNCEN